ncbi:MAG TPA: lysophospholipid acyltransferase family protein [Streptosporangiaceae bacterium]|nr:lysophospholipid acyltransferase family protein [Streptosporangiaceae bacterium]
MFYWVVKAILAPILRLVFRPWAEGTEYVPRTGPAILASNHLSFSDHFFAPLPLPRKVVFLAKSEYFTGRGLKGLFSKAFMSGVGQIPMDRSGGEASERALATGLRVLADGHLLGIYPEGTRTPDGRLFRGKTGVARLALEARVPVIPCAMIGGFEFQPPGTIAPRLRIRPGVRFGKPLDFARYYGLETDRIVLRAITDEIIYEIMKLSGQEYVDEYAQRNKSRAQQARRARKQQAEPGSDGAGGGGAGGGAASAGGLLGDAAAGGASGAFGGADGPAAAGGAADAGAGTRARAADIVRSASDGGPAPDDVSAENAEPVRDAGSSADVGSVASRDGQ